MSKKIDLAKQAQALERLKAEFERLNRQFDELKAASGVASDDELVVDESKLPPEVRTAFLEMKAQAEKNGRNAAASLEAEIAADEPAPAMRRPRRGTLAI